MVVSFALVTSCANPVQPENGVITLRKPLGKNIRVHEWTSSILSAKHLVFVWLPPDYDSSARDRRFPVLYMQDGQGLFAGAVDLTDTTGWHLDETAFNLINTKQMQSCIIVGITSEPTARDREYTPTHLLWWINGSGEAKQYGQMLTREIKPFIDSLYRTKPDRANTVIGGSSFGGLVSLYLGLSYPATFGGWLLLSPSVWWDNRFVLRQIRDYPEKKRPRVWLDVGTNETPALPSFVIDMHFDAQLLRDTLRANGWADSTLSYSEADGDTHNDQAWRKRMRKALPYMFPIY